MRNKLSVISRLGLVLVLGWAATMSARAEIKIGTASLRKIFEGYYVTQQADEELKSRVGDVEKERQKMLDDYKKKTEDYRKLAANAADQAVSSEERERRKKNAESLLTELQEYERSIKQFMTNSDKTLQEQRMRMRDGVLKKIRETVVTKARAGGYNLILDTSAETADRTEVILFSTDLPDLSDEILRDLNASAPAGWVPKAAASSTPEPSR
jgi:Skp family chaperone for outer membrane proteins